MPQKPPQTRNRPSYNRMNFDRMGYTLLEAFRHQATLFRPGDRIKFRPIDRDEYDWIEREVDAGTYRYLIWDYDLFSLSRYRAWAASLGAPTGPAS